MLEWELQLPLDRLRPTKAQLPTPDVRTRVSQHQHRMKQRFDKAHRVKSPGIRVSDWVRSKWLHRSDKLQSFWSSPLRVRRQLSAATFQLQYGSQWHASRLRKVPPPEPQPVPFGHHGTSFWPSSSDVRTNGGALNLLCLQHCPHEFDSIRATCRTL